MTVTPEIEQPFGLLFVPDDPILVPASVETPPPFAAYVPGVADELPPLVVNAPFHTTGCELSGPRAAAVRDWQARKERERRAWAAPDRFPCTLLPPDTDPFQRPHKDLLILTVAEPRPLPAPQIVPAIALDSDEPFRLALTVKRTQCAWALPVAALFVPDDQAIAPVMCDHHVQYNIYGWESEEVQCEELEREVLESGEDVVHLPRVGGGIRSGRRW
ncbi:hypothetical protein B0H10DRAFT_907179 [Mycena sp. CBHHK59/15]|nr:hypothetical protein B0H10DRAFT_907179 [Mycena sp. CBHHK59/15]